MRHDDRTTQLRVRFAPSPTGYLHIGGLRAALYNWLLAKQQQGVFLLRIEDTDLERSTQEYTDSILNSLAWAGITPDEPIVIQSSRIEEHKKVIAQLLAENKAYRCYCTPEEVEARHKARGVTDSSFTHYDGYCRTRKAQPDDANKPFAVRFAIPRDLESVTFDDQIRGSITIPIEQLDDLVIARSDGSPTYNFVVVVDDAQMGVTLVLRGEDHISNTPKQILLYQACGYPVPAFAHLPLILGKSGAKLSKRDAATAVIDYCAQGYLPDALINYLVRLGWAHGDQEIFTREEMIKYFSLAQVTKKGAIFDPAKLDWLNGHYLRNTPNPELLERITRDVDRDFVRDMTRWDVATLSLLIDLYKQRAKTLKEIVTEIRALHSAPTTYDAQSLEKWVNAGTVEHLKSIKDIFTHQWTSDHAQLAAICKEWCAEHALQLVAIAQPLRLALIGKTVSPGVFELITILGKDEAIQRINALIAYLERTLHGQ